MNVSSVQSSTSSAVTDATASTGSITGMGGDQFMQLLLAQMQNQDPLDPVQDKDFMTEMTQINSLMEMEQVSSNIQALTLSNQMIQAASLIGKDVSYAASDGSSMNGVVSGVTYAGDQINLSVGDAQVPLKNLTGVQLDAGYQVASNG